MKLATWTTIVCLSFAAPVLSQEAPAVPGEVPQTTQEAVVSGSSRFALDLYGALRSREGNLCIAPFGTSTALAMAHAGARGETARQMAAVLHLPTRRDDLDRVFGSLLPEAIRASAGPANRFHMANALWGQEGLELLGEYGDLMAKEYGGGLQRVDFTGDPAEACKTINRWVGERTEQVISRALRPGDLTEITSLILTSALYFQGAWAHPFDRKKTRDADFHLRDGRSVQVPLMAQMGRFRLARMADLDLLELPYEGGALSMLLLLPKDPKGLEGMEGRLEAELHTWLSRLEKQVVRVYLPRFRVDTRVHLAAPLADLGMADAFSAGKADFSGMTGRRELFVEKVICQARVQVDERGTEGAGSTVVQLGKGGGPAVFRADHPFLFLIRDRKSGTVLFLGRLTHPQDQPRKWGQSLFYKSNDFGLLRTYERVTVPNLWGGG